MHHNQKGGKQFYPKNSCTGKSSDKNLENAGKIFLDYMYKAQQKIDYR